MLRKTHIVVLALVAAAVAAPIAQAANSKPVDPLAVSMLLSQGFSPSQVAAMTGTEIPLPASIKPADPLAVSMLTSMGLTPGEVNDWTVGVCSHEVRPASCFAAFQRPPAEVPSVTTGGFDWADAGIGAGATLGLVLLAVGLGFMLVTRVQRRHDGRLKHA